MIINEINNFDDSSIAKTRERDRLGLHPARLWVMAKRRAGVARSLVPLAVDPQPIEPRSVVTEQCRMEWLVTAIAQELASSRRSWFRTVGGQWREPPNEPPHPLRETRNDTASFA